MGWGGSLGLTAGKEKEMDETRGGGGGGGVGFFWPAKLTFREPPQ